MHKLIIVWRKSEMFFAKVSPEDYERCAAIRWYLHRDGYAVKAGGGTLHCFIMGRAGDGLEWDHTDRDKLNCQRDNLKAVTHLENMNNIYGKCVYKNNTSGVPGVSRRYGKWRGRRYFRGKEQEKSFDTLEEAIAFNKS